MNSAIRTGYFVADMQHCYLLIRECLIESIKIREKLKDS